MKVKYTVNKISVLFVLIFILQLPNNSDAAQAGVIYLHREVHYSAGIYSNHL